MKKKLYILMTLLCCLLLCVIFAACNNKNKACDHRHATAVDTVIGTSCEDGGVRTYTCPDCSKTWEEKVAKFEHNFVDDSEESHPATCTSPGELIQRCTRCNKMTSLPEQQLQHNYVKDEKNSHPADCITPGVVIEICSRCNDRKETTTPALGHKWEGTDCTGKVCSECEEKLPATKEHSYQIDDKKTEAATCTKDGETVYVCSECQDSYTVTVPKTGHDYQIVANSESGEYKLVDKSNCTYETSHRLKCKNCTDEKIETYTVENRHTYKTVITKEATCNAAGEKAVICSVCNHQNGEAETIAIDENAHKWNGGEKVGNITTFTCELCRHTKKSIAAAENVTEVPVGKEDLLQADDVVVNNASIAFDETAKNSLPADKELTLGVTVANNAADIDSSLKDKLENDVYNITLSTGNDNITSFDGGKVTVRIPYTLAEGEDVDAIVIWYVDGGKLTNITGTYANGYVTFETEHFSYYTVGKYTPEEMCAIYGHHDLTRTKEATCTESGYSFTICTRCGVQEEETTYTPATGHNFETDVTSESKAPTCTANGVEVKKCTKCDAKFSTQLPATGHTWKEGKKVDATCEHSGSTTYSCENCDATYTITTPQRPHEYNSVKKEATCEEDGYTTYTCKYCQYSYKGDIISAFGHKWDRLEPTCGDPKKCTVCGKEGAPATGKHSYVNGVCSVCGEGCEHNWVKSGDVESTCRVPGYTLYKCSKCNTEKKDDYKELGDHNFGSDGRCTVCGTRDESAATNFYETLFKSLSAKKFTITTSDDFVVKFSEKNTYDGCDVVYIVTVKKGAIYVNITDDGKILLSGDATVKYEEAYDGQKSDSNTMKFKAMVDGDYLYFKMNSDNMPDQYVRIRLGEIPEPGATILSLIRDKDVVDYLKNIFDTNKKDLLNLVTEIADALFERTQTANGYDVVFNNQVVLDFNEDLKNLSITQLIDKYFGEGAFDEIAESLRELTFDLTVADLIDKAYEIAAQYGIDKDTLFSLANAMYTKYFKQIFESDSEESGDFDVSDFIQGDFMSKTIAEIIEEEVGWDKGEFAKYFDQAVEDIKAETLSVYAIIAKEVDWDEFGEDFIYNIVKSAFDDGTIEIALNTDKTGKIRSFGFAFNKLNVTVLEDYTVEVNGKFNMQWNESKEFVFDKDLDIASDLFDFIREQCKKSKDGIYTCTDVKPLLDGYTTSSEASYVWQLKDDVLSLTATQTIYIVDSVLPTENGRIETGTKTVTECNIYNVENTVLCSKDCGDWFEYILRNDNGSRKEKSGSFTREYDKSGELLDESENFYSFGSFMPQATLYFNSKTHEFSSVSQHNEEVDTQRSTTKDDVACSEFYYTYYVCSECKTTTRIESTKKAHTFKETGELLPGSKTCYDGAVITRECTECGHIAKETVYYHKPMYNIETYDLPDHGSFTNGKLIIRISYCACGEENYIYVDTQDGCDFDYSNEEYLENGHRLKTYKCPYDGCTAYYTIEQWEEEIDACTYDEHTLYMFYYSEGKTLGNKDGYERVSRSTNHIYGESTTKRIEFTFEKDGFDGYREETSYTGCTHTGPFKRIEEYHYDAIGRLIYNYYERQGYDAYYRWTKYEYESLESCKCKVTNCYNGSENSYTDTIHANSISDWVDATCTTPEYYYTKCSVCGEGECKYYRAPHGHEFYEGTCEYCGLEAAQEASGSIVLEDKTEYWDEDAQYTVGVWDRNYSGSSVDILLQLVYLDGDEEKTVEFTGKATRVELPGKELTDYWPVNCYMITVDRVAVRAAVEAGMEFVGLRLTFIPMDGSSTQVIAITLVDPYFAEA